MLDAYEPEQQHEAFAADAFSDLLAADLAREEADFAGSEDECIEAAADTSPESDNAPYDRSREQPDLPDAPTTQSRYPSAYRDLAAALSLPEYDIPEYAMPENEAPRSQNRREDHTLIDPFADELADEAGQDPVGLRGLQWLRRNVSSLRVTVSLQRKPPASKLRKPFR